MDGRTDGRTDEQTDEWKSGHLCRKVGRSGKCFMQGLMVVGLIVEEISNVDAKYVKVTGAQNIGQGHRVKVPAKSVHLEEALCKVW